MQPLCRVVIFVTAWQHLYSASQIIGVHKKDVQHSQTLCSAVCIPFQKAKLLPLGCHPLAHTRRSECSLSAYQRCRWLQSVDTLPILRALHPVAGCSAGSKDPAVQQTSQTIQTITAHHSHIPAERSNPLNPLKQSEPTRAHVNARRPMNAIPSQPN